MKPRIFIAMHYLETGGAESALIGMLHALDPKRVDVDLFIYRHSGPLMKLIPGWVRLLPEIGAYASLEIPLWHTIRRGHLAVAAGRVAARCRLKRYVRRNNPADWSAMFGYIGRHTAPAMPSLRRFGRYDLAISYLTPHDYVLRHVDAARKVCWIHTDYTRIDVDTQFELPVWSAYDRIVSISPDVTESFCSRFPSLRGKITEIANMTCPEIVRRGAQGPRPADMPATPGHVQLLTIGRYCHPKNLDAIPGLCRRLAQRGIDADWHIIGYGDSDAYIREAIRRENMEERVHILGKRDNPYPYIAACDWYVQPSRYEGKSVVVGEAQMLGRPVIVTDYPTASSQVADGVDGIIVPMAPDACAEAMARAITDTALRDSIMHTLATRDYSNAAEAEKIYRLIQQA